MTDPAHTTPDEPPAPLFNLERVRRMRAQRSAGQRLRAFPLIEHLRSYSRAKFKHDARAGLNVALLDFPQGMAYALIAGLPFQHGVYASAIAAMIGPLLASSRFVMFGPTNAIAVLCLSAFMGLKFSPEQVLYAMPLLLVMVGVFLIAGAFLGVARLINYISRSVVTGYITAAAFLIIGNQLRHVLGFSIPSASTFYGVVHATLANIANTQWPPLLLALGTVVVYLLVKRYVRFLPTVAVTLIVAALANWALGNAVDGWQVRTLQAIPSGSWPLSLPPLDPELIRSLLPAAFAIAFLSVLESSSIAKTLAARAGDRVNINQQMLSMGVANIGCAFGSGMPISGSLTRSALNFASGARTPIASMISGALLAVGVLVLGRWIGLIPVPALAMLVILIGISLINRKNIRVMLGSTNSDAAVFITTLVAGLLLPLDSAIYIGTGLSIMLFLHKASIPQLQEYNFTEQGELAEITLKEQRARPHIAILHVEGDLFFGASEIFIDEMRRVAEDPSIRIFILRLKNAHNLDATCAMAIEEFIRFLRSSGRDLIVSGATDEIYRIFRDSGLLRTLGRDNFFLNTPENPNISTRNALKRSQQLLGKEAADIVLLVNKKKDGAGAN